MCDTRRYSKIGTQRVKYMYKDVICALPLFLLLSSFALNCVSNQKKSFALDQEDSLEKNVKGHSMLSFVSTLRVEGELTLTK